MRSHAPATKASLDPESMSWWKTTDPLRLAQAQLFGLLAALALGLHLALVLRAELAFPAQSLLGSQAIGGSLSGHSLVLVFLFALPCLPLFLAGLVLPPLVGASNLAFPALNRSTVRLYLASFAVLGVALVSGSIDEIWGLAPAAGSGISWPLTLIALGLHGLGFALVFNALNQLATLLWERRHPLSQEETPVLVWALASGAAVQFVVAIALASLGALLVLQHATPALVFGGLAGDPLAYERLFAFILHAGVAVVVLPAIGIVFEVFATFCRKAPVGGLSNGLSLAALALLSLAGSGVSLAADGVSPAFLVAASGLNLLALIPASILLFNLIATLVGGSIEITTPFLHALILLTLLTLGGLAGLFLVTLSTGSYLQGSLFDTAQLHFLMGGAAIAGLFTALYYWWPRLAGRRTRESLGRWGAALLFAGYSLTFLPHFVEGSQGISTLSLLSGQAAATVASVGVLGNGLLVLAFLVIGWDFLSSLFGETEDVQNPWLATTREWLSGDDTLSPYDFAALLLDDRATADKASPSSE